MDIESLRLNKQTFNRRIHLLPGCRMMQSIIV